MSQGWQLGATLVIAVSGSAQLAWAQEWLLGGFADASSGLEGRSERDAPGVRRARTTVRFGGDLRVDENPNVVYSAALLAEIDPRTSMGVDVHYGRLLGLRWLTHVGVIAFVTPQTLFGASFGVTYRQPVSSGVAFTLGASANAYFVGSDLPSPRPLLQAMFRGGVHVDL